MKALWLLLTTILATAWLSAATVGVEELVDSDMLGVDLDEDYEAEPLGDIEAELEELIEEEPDDDWQEEVVYEEDTEQDEENDEEGDTEGGRRNRNNRRQKSRATIRKVSRFARRNNVTDVLRVPGRVFGQKLRRVHNNMRRNDDDDESASADRPVRAKATKVYRKIVRVVESRLHSDNSGRRFDRMCANLDRRAGPRQRAVDDLPQELQPEFVAMYDARKEQLTECCDMEGEEREECFQDAYEEKMDGLCTIQFAMDQFPSRMNTMFLRMMSRRQECCQILEPSDRSDCFKANGRSARRQKRSANDGEDWSSLTPQRRMDNLCSRMQEHGAARRGEGRGEMTEERREMLERKLEEVMQCCEMEGSDRLRCGQAIKRRKLEDVCTESEERGRRGLKQQIKERCCHLEESEKEACFSEAIREQLAQRMDRRQEVRAQRREQRQESRRAERQRRDVTEDDDDDEEDWVSLSPQRKVDKICRKIDQHSETIDERLDQRSERRGMTDERRAMIEDRMEDMVECCQLEGAARLTCAQALKRTKVLAVCSETQFRGERGEKKRELKERCCDLEEREKETCFDNAIQEFVEQKSQRRSEKRTERRDERQEGRREGGGARREGNGERRQQRQERREGREQRREGRHERREGTGGGRQAERQERRQGRREERRRIRVEIEEEVEIEGDESRQKREIGEQHRRGMGRRRNGQHRRGQGNDDTKRHRGDRSGFRSCCIAGREFGLTIDLPNDGIALREHANQCAAAAIENAPSLGANDSDACASTYMRCCVKSKRRGGRHAHNDDDDEDDEGRRHREMGGRRRRVRVEVEDEIHGDPDVAIEELLDVAEEMVAMA